jgi:serine/threonine protein kinase
VRRVALGEPWAYKQIAAALEEKRLRPEIRICRFYSVVIDEDCNVLQHYIRAPQQELAKWGDDFESESESPPRGSADCGSKRMVGILITYIENKGTLHEVAPWSDCLDEKRRCWAAELECLVRELHAAGLVWGDAKPHNVLVDQEDRLWLIDFDGGYTYGWVDEVKNETQEGDLQGVERIKEWLVSVTRGLLIELSLEIASKHCIMLAPEILYSVYPCESKEEDN